MAYTLAADDRRFRCLRHIAGFARAGLLIAAALSGCAENPDGRPGPATAPVSLSSIPAQRAQASFWLRKPPSVSIASVDFSKLFNACATTLTRFNFRLDRQDYREGLLTSLPEESKQFFELWRRDTGTQRGVLENSLQSTRRTLRIDIVRSADGYFLAHPRIVIEREALVEHRVTSVTEYRSVYLAPAGISQHEDDSPQGGPGGLAASGAGQRATAIPNRYWYAVGRDESLERQLADDIRRQLSSSD